MAFRSYATDLVGNDDNAWVDVFVHDRATGRTRRVSLRSDGTEANGDSYDPAISADGRYVAFWSDATNLVGNDTNAKTDVFVRGPLR